MNIDIEQLYADAEKLSVGLVLTEGTFKSTKEQAETLFDKYFSDDFSTMTVNLGGHSKGKYDNKTIAEINEMPYEKHFAQTLKKVFTSSLSILIRDIVKNEHPKDRIIEDFKFNLEFPVSSPSNYCFSCGCNSSIYLNGNEFNMYSEHIGEYNKIAQSECKFPKGFGVDTLYMHFNSGKMVVANNLCSLFEETVDKGDYITEKSGYYNTINSDYGVYLNTRYWAEKGLMYLQVGNTSPKIFVKKDGVITFKNEFIYSPKTEEESLNYTPDETLIGYVCTDVWAVCGMDYDLFMALCKERDIDPKTFLVEKYCTVIENLPKGIYKITDNTSIKTSKKQKTPYGVLEYTTSESRAKDKKFKKNETVYPLEQASTQN